MAAETDLSSSVAAATGARGGPGRSALALLAWTSGALKSAVMMAAGLVATPYLLRYLGAERLGAFRAAQQWNAYLYYLYLGLSPALMVMLLQATNAGNRDRLSALVRSGARLLIRQSFLVVLPCAAILAWFMPDLVPVSRPLRSELRTGAIIYLLMIVISPLEISRLVLECLQLGYLTNIGLMIQSVVVAAASVLLAWWGFGLPGQFAAAVLGTALFFALTAVFALPRLRGVSSAPRVPIDSSALWRLRWPMTITGVGGQVNLLTDYIVVGYMIDPVSVTVFSITQRLVTVLGAFITSLTNVSWAGLAEVLSTEGSAMLEARMLELVRLLVGVGLAVVGTLAAFNAHFVTLWVGRQYYAGDALTLLTAIQTILFGFSMLFANTIDMQGDTRHRVGVTSAGAALNLTLSLLLVRPFGMSGVTLGTVLGYLAADAWYSPYLACRRYGMRGRAIVLETLRSLALCIPWVFAVWFWVHTRAEIATWREFALDFFAANAIATIYCWFIILTRADRNLWRMRLSGMSSMFGSRRN